MRDLVSVIDKILAAVPDTETVLREELESRKSSAMFAPPESQAFWWRMTAETLMVGVGNPDGIPWKEQVAFVFTGASQ